MSDPCRPLDLVLLKSFVAVVDKGGFTAAANHLHLAQSTISAHIKRLENVLERSLLQRKLQMAVPTAAGERLLSHARQMLRRMPRPGRTCGISAWPAWCAWAYPKIT